MDDTVWAAHKSSVPKSASDEDDTPPDEPLALNDNWHGQKRTNETHASTTDGQARLFRKSKGTGAMLRYMGHVLTDNHHGLIVNTPVTLATGTAERNAAAQMLRGKFKKSPEGSLLFRKKVDLGFLNNGPSDARTYH